MIGCPFASGYKSKKGFNNYNWNKLKNVGAWGPEKKSESQVLQEARKCITWEILKKLILKQALHRRKLIMKDVAAE